MNGDDDDLAFLLENVGAAEVGDGHGAAAVVPPETESVPRTHRLPHETGPREVPLSAFAYKAILHRLDIRHMQAMAELGITERQSRRLAAGHSEVPMTMKRLLAVLLELRDNERK